MTEQQQAAEGRAAPETGLNPLQALRQLANIIDNIDHHLVMLDRRETPRATLRRATYARNTLVVALTLWQDDVLRRLAQSRQSFYVYCMTDAERTAFTRRISPGLYFTAEELADIGVPAFAPLVPLVEQAAENAVRYATENRQSLIIAKNGLGPREYPAILSFRAMALPADDPRAGAA